MKVLFISLISFLLSVASIAALSCRQAHWEPRIEIWHLAPGVTIVEAQSAIATIRDILQKFVAKPFVPKIIRLEISEQGRNKYVDYQSKISIRAIREPGKDAFLAHELGHAILAMYIRALYPKYDKWLENEERKMQHLEKLPSVEDPIDLFLVAEPYEEVGADLIAVLHRRNPKAMADAGRDFTVPVSIEDWNNPVPHMQLNPIRNLLWTQYFSHPENAPHTSKMVDIVFHVLAQAAIDHLENGPRNIPIPELNKRVAEKLRQALKRFEQ